MRRNVGSCYTGNGAIAHLVPVDVCELTLGGRVHVERRFIHSIFGGRHAHRIFNSFYIIFIILVAKLRYGIC